MALQPFPCLLRVGRGPFYRYSNVTTGNRNLHTEDIFVNLSLVGIFVRPAQRKSVTGMLVCEYTGQALNIDRHTGNLLKSQTGHLFPPAALGTVILQISRLILSYGVPTPDLY